MSSWLFLDTVYIAIIVAIVAIVLYRVIKQLLDGKKLLRDEWNQKHFALTDKLDRAEEEFAAGDGTILKSFVYRSKLSPGGPESAERLPGPAILFYHGFGGFAQNVHFEPMLAMLAMAGYTVFAYDFRWSGHSRIKGQGGPLQGVIVEGPDLFGKFIKDGEVAIDWVLSHENLVDPDRLAIVGFSMGGTIALSDSVINNPRVKAIVAGCAMFDVGETLHYLFTHRGMIMMIVAPFILSIIKRHTGLSSTQVFARASELSPSHSVKEGEGLPDLATSRLFLAHCKDDEIVNFSINFPKSKAFFQVPDENCVVFETGGHEFKTDTLVLAGWILTKLRAVL